MTPRQFYAQLAVHKDVTEKLYGGASTNTVAPSASSASSGYIDQIPGW